MVRAQLDEQQWPNVAAILETQRGAGRRGKDDRNFTAPAPFDKDLYKDRVLVPCTIHLLKQARRFATRYEKTLRNYAAVVAIGCALLWLRI
jgi:transposase